MLKVSRRVVMIGLGQYTLIWVKMLGRIDPCIYYYDFGRLTHAITKSWGFPYTPFAEHGTAGKGDLP